MTDLKMTLAEVALSHAVTNPLGRWLGQRRFAFDCMCGGTITEDRNTDPSIDRDTAYNMHLLVAAMKAITPAKTQEHAPLRLMGTDAGTFVVCSCGSNPTPKHWLETHWTGDRAEGVRLVEALIPEPTAEGKSA